MQKLLIVETDYHGSGYIVSRNNIEPYAYDMDTGDAGAVFRHLLNEGIVSPDEVKVKALEEVLIDYYNHDC